MVEGEVLKIIDEWESDFVDRHVFFAVSVHELAGDFVGMWCEAGSESYYRHRFKVQPSRDEVEEEYCRWRWARRS